MLPNIVKTVSEEISTNTLCEDLKDLILEPDLIDSFEDRVVRQFMEALLFEGLVDYTKLHISENYCKDFSYNKIYNHKVEISISNTTLQCVAHFGAFDRIRIAEKSVKILKSRFYSRAGIEDVIKLLILDNEIKHQLQSELTQTILLCRWNDKNIASNKLPRRSLPYQNLESAIHEGHLYHPCFKTRTGFTLNDHILYGPESANSFKLSWLAIRKSLLSSNLPRQEEAYWHSEIGISEYAKLFDLIKQHGVNQSDYSLVPIHPWQLKNLKVALDSALTRQDILSLGEAGDLYQASQSIRTLINVSNPDKANVKLPLNITCTSSHRNLQKHFICTSPTLSSWLQEIVAKDEYLQKNNALILLSEYAGISFESSDTSAFTKEQAETATLLEGKIGAIYRNSVSSKINTGESAIPFTALMLCEPDGELFIADWLNKFGIENWVSQLLDTMLIPIWHMLVHHGIAFEAHAQNLILIHKQGWPEKIVLRDFHESTEYVDDFLRLGQNTPDLTAVDPFFRDIATNDGFSVESEEYLRELFMDTVYVFNLTELAFKLNKFHEFSETTFWKMVKDKLNHYEKSNITVPERIKRINANKDQVVVESLLHKKIKGGGFLDFYEHQVTNTLAKKQPN